jgi:hypothetical protein
MIIAAATTIFLTGCTTLKNHHIETVTIGDREYKRVCFTRATTIGQGETWGDISDACGGTLQREESNTGLSDNGRAAIEDAVRAGVCAATKGVGCR